MKILYNIASRSRPLKCKDVIDNIISMAKHDDFRIIVTADFDDPTMFSEEVIKWMYHRLPNGKVWIYFGNSTGKIDAINKNVTWGHNYPWEIVVNVSDDQLFVKEGFDLQIIQDMKKYFPDTDGVLHYHDGHKYGDKLMSLSIIGRKYYDRDGFIYHPDFISLYCDNLAKDVAVIRGKYKYLGDGNILFNHLHPANTPGVPTDDQYRHTESFYEEDQKTYIRHKANNYYLNV